ncbi:hypothetical protein ES319_D10G000500v1 [Gossypium barbadense]|uniref:Uncharacterized protein n=1 Tax=Gossypium barbadense TaxID=3634 RepID=A0A5J5PJW3_GOSBA|nr:hypothetical protein ES319_D10G000500v1 [Gossypium barbadense]
MSLQKHSNAWKSLKKLNTRTLDTYPYIWLAPDSKFTIHCFALCLKSIDMGLSVSIWLLFRRLISVEFKSGYLQAPMLLN